MVKDVMLPMIQAQHILKQSVTCQRVILNQYLQGRVEQEGLEEEDVTE